jgi:hypothetical protein
MPGEWQGTEGWKEGNLRRYLQSVALFELDPTTTPGENVTRELWLTGLSGNLKLQISVGMIREGDDGNSTPYVWPADGGTVQLYPTTKFPDVGQRRVFLRPVFQDPTDVTNTNEPLPQELPFGWEGAFTMADDVMIEVTLNAAAFASTALTGQVVVQVVVEYNGAWWDIAAISRAMGKVNLTGGSVPQKFGTGGE